MSAATPRSYNAPLARHFVQPRVTASMHLFAFAVPGLVIPCSPRRSPLCGRSKVLAAHADLNDSRPARGLNTMSSMDDTCSSPSVVGGHDIATQQQEHALASSNLTMARTSAETESRLADLAEERAPDMSAPLVSAVMEESQRVRANFFCPGHKQGVGAGQQLRRCVGEAALRHDVPELPALDNLFSPTGVIADAQRLATDAFVGNGAMDMGWSTFFLVNGSTCGIEAAVLATVRPGRKILLPRNVHQSAIHALVLSGATPVWLEPQYDSERDLLHCIRPASVAIALAEHHGQVDAVLLVSPTYH
jgi:Orn/Lys/Arg decarboxylase, major domain